MCSACAPLKDVDTHEVTANRADATSDLPQCAGAIGKPDTNDENHCAQSFVFVVWRRAPREECRATNQADALIVPAPTRTDDE